MIKDFSEYELPPYYSDSTRTMTVGTAFYQKRKTRTDRFLRVQSGSLVLNLDGNEKVFEAQEMAVIPAGHTFGISNQGTQDTQFVETIDGIVPNEEDSTQ